MIKHKFVLNTQHSPPVHLAPYRADLKQRELEQKEVAQLEKASVAELAVTKWALLIVFVLKKDESFRFSVEYRRLNTVTVRDSYPIPCMEDCIDYLGKKKLFSTFFAGSGYRQIEMDKRNVDKMEFVTHNGICKYTRMPSD